MATTTQYTLSDADQDVGLPPAVTRRPLFPAIRWGAVLAGVAVGISVQLALTLLGIATGLSTTKVTEGETVGMGPLIWAGISMLVAAFIGGYVAARMSGLKRKADGVLHGAVSWAVTTILFSILATSAGGTMLSGVFGNMGQLARTSGGQSAMASVQEQMRGMDADALRRFQQSIQAGDREGAIRQLTSSLGMDRTRATAMVDQALILSGSPEAASPQSRAMAESAMQTAGAAAWVVFLAVALSLVLGVAGGALGAAGSRRVSWSTTAPTPARAS
jgi:hypothetical protein